MTSIPPYALAAAALALAPSTPYGRVGDARVPEKAIPRAERERRKEKKKQAKQSRRRNRK